MATYMAKLRTLCTGAKRARGRIRRSCNNGSGKGLAAGMFIAIGIFLVVVFIWDIGGSGPGLMVKIKLLQNHLQVGNAPLVRDASLVGDAPLVGGASLVGNASLVGDVLTTAWAGLRARSPAC